jgi:SAM-dependent methyltransferase
VLVVGAGRGLYTLRLLEDGHHVLAVDLSPACLSQIEARVAGTPRARQLSVRAGDFLEVARELRQGRFDAVTFIKVLHHFPDRAAIESALARAYDLLAPGGKLLVFEPNGGHPLWPPILLSRGLEHWRNEKNVRLVRRRFLEEVASRLPGARSSVRYRFVIPGGLVKRFPSLAQIDRRICRRDRPWLDYLAVNVAFEITKAS